MSRLEESRPLRRDAAENAERLMAAAIRAGVAEGRHVPLAQIAADAGVGVGTLYRRYPNREALLAALQARAYETLLTVAREAMESASTGLDAVERFLTRSFEHRDEFVLPLHGVPVVDHTDAARLRDELALVMDELVELGHRDGSLRPDITAWTVVRFGAMLAQPMTTTRGWDTTAKEQRAVFLRGISAP